MSQINDAAIRAKARTDQALAWVKFAKEGKLTGFSLSMIELHLKAADEILAKAEIQPAREAA